MIHDGVLKKIDGTYSVAVMIQDGVERQNGFLSLLDAIHAYRDMQLAYNNKQNAKPKLYEEKRVIKTEINQVG